MNGSHPPLDENTAASLAYAGQSPFPPSFDGNPWAYAFGLFGDIVAAALALTMLLTLLLESRRNREVDRLVQNWLPSQPGVPAWSPLFLYRASTASVLLFIVMRAAPDALWMLAWGEVSEAAIRVMLAIDLWADGLALAPMFFAVTCWCLGRQVIPQKLLAGPAAQTAGRPDWQMLWKNGRIVLVVLVIAVGVTIGKASA